MSAIGSAGAIAGGIATLAQLRSQYDAALKAADDEADNILAGASSYSRSMQAPTIDIPTLTPSEDLFLPGQLFQRAEGGVSYGWVAPIVLGVVGLGVLGWLVVRKQ
jgi:hypothetical protein